MEPSDTLDTRYDVVIVGARCAGASTAMLLARAGAKVLMVDRQAYGRDIVSTHALMRSGVLQLNRWGLLPKLMAASTSAIRRTTFHYGEEGISVDIKAENGVDYLIAPRRTVLDPVLVDAARDAGAEVQFGVSLVDLLFSANGRVTGVLLKGRHGQRIEVGTDLVVGADGRQSLVSKLVGAPTLVQGGYASAYVYGYFEDLPDTGCHWYFEKGVAAGRIPTNDNQHCVFASVPVDRFKAVFSADRTRGFLEIAEANSGELREALEKARIDDHLRGFVGIPGYIKQSHGPGWCLVGDAGYFKDPLTAHGITDALRDAELLSHAVQVGSSQAFVNYQWIRDTLSKSLFEVTNEIASFQWDMEDVKALHSTLSNAMKAETNYIEALSGSSNLAA